MPSSLLKARRPLTSWRYVEGRHELVMRYTRFVAGFDRFAQGDIAFILDTLQLIKLIDRYEHRRRPSVLRQHDALMAVPSTINQLTKLAASLRNRARERHDSTV